MEIRTIPNQEVFVLLIGMETAWRFSTLGTIPLPLPLDITQVSAPYMGLRFW